MFNFSKGPSVWKCKGCGRPFVVYDALIMHQRSCLQNLQSRMDDEWLKKSKGTA